MKFFLGCICLFLVFICGCTTTPVKSKESQSDSVSAMARVAQGLTNQPLTSKDLKSLAVKVSTDKQAQSALRSINTALSPQHTVKYCPMDGERFSADVDMCPVHRIKLKWVD